MYMRMHGVYDCYNTVVVRLGNNHPPSSFYTRHDRSLNISASLFFASLHGVRVVDRIDYLKS